jgi:cell filamentation protein
MMNDIYLIENSSVLKNKLGITDEKELDLAEAELSRMNMMLLYEEGFDDFSPEGLRYIHRILFRDVYDWAGEYRKINIRKREKVLAGNSVWYSNVTEIEKDLKKAFTDINKTEWEKLDKEAFVKHITMLFPKLWQVHPFREGNTRATVMLMTFFIEHYGYYFDQVLLAQSAGYVRDSFVMASIGDYAEYEHLEMILSDAISETPVEYTDTGETKKNKSEKYQKYKSDDYVPEKHEYID